ncbi:multicopper oxidase family protein [Enhygromyxa salina]|uniref:Copper resistance protein A n=1 Tax=Enhygromyxa salina TaxID=215803 RepID=A0A2S9YFM8_9BACT|nr:copper oxidase [Enhygromyxa salina]PRQ03913.1 Copper resistance protein A precursor [Enhygromyxa salina]
MDRRSFLQLSSLAAAGSVLAHAGTARATEPQTSTLATSPTRSRTVAPTRELAVVTPNGSTLAWKLVDGVKVGHLIAEPIDHEFAPGLRATCWGYNGSTPGPTIEAVEGDRLRIYVSNRLPEPTTVHWHGLILPNGMDGVSGLNQAPIAPGQTFMYEFTVDRPGTFMYHPHYDEMTQIALGMAGMFIVHPRRPRGPRVDRDFALMTHEWRLDVGARRVDPNEMNDFNLLTFNSKAFPGTQPLLIGRGERVRIRLGNLNPMDHHPVHLHGVSFEVTETDGGYVQPSARRPETTVLLPVGSVRVIEFAYEQSGDWAMHCHMTHHVMTQMGHGLPPMVGVDTHKLDRRMARVDPRYMSMGTTGMGGMGDMDMPIPPNSLPMRGGPGPFATVDMGGMFTILKVRDQPQASDVDGWYTHPPGTVASLVDPDQMAVDGIVAP